MTDDVKINVVTLEDGKEYYEIRKMPLNGVDYLILSGVEDEKFTVRKLAQEDGKERLYISKLDSEEELQFVLKSFLADFNINS